MTKDINSRPASTNSKNQVFFDDQFIKNVTETVNYVLRKNAGSWISSEDIEEIASMARYYILIKSEKYDPEQGASFKTWYTTCAHNFAISASKKLKNAVDRVVCINSLIGFDNTGGNISADPTKNTRTRKFNYRSDSTFGWAAKELGINIDEYAADYTFNRESEEKASMKRLARLEEFLDSKLNDREKLMLEMLKEKRTKEEMMAKMNMNGGYVDKFKSCLRSKIRDFMTSIDYYGIDDE